MKLLWINCRILHPLIGGDRIRTYQMLKVLKKRHEITYLCLQTPRDLPDAIGRADEYCDRFVPVAHPDRQTKSLRNRLRLAIEALFSSQPLISTRYRSREWSQKILDLVQSENFDLVICDYLAPMINLLEIHGRIGVPIVLFHHNVESQIWERHFRNSRNPVIRWLYHLQWHRTARLEDASASIVDGQIAVSENDYRHFADTRRMPGVLGAVPTGVDFEAFKPNPDRRESNTIAFLGAMDWHANIDAVDFFVKEILPKIRARIPGVRLLIVGRNPAKAILSLSENDPGIEVSGTVGDVLPWLQRSSVMILPLRVGGGTRIKVYESIAAGVPVVSTGVGVEGLDLEPGRHFRQADDAASFASETAGLLEQEELAQQVAREALDHISTRYGWEAVCDRFCELCRKVL